MTSILVTGANGFVGRAVCAALVQKGHTVRAALRNPARFSIAGCEVTKVPSIEADADWSEALHGITTVIHLVARVHVMQDKDADPLEAFRSVNTAGAERLARAAAASGVKRLVYVSSIKVNGEGTVNGHQYSEKNDPAPHDPYSISKWEAEQALWRVSRETGMEVVIVRPPLVYGAGVKGNFIQLLKVLAKRIPLPLASVCNQRSLVYVENLSDALTVCATHPAAAGQTYLVSDGEDISTPGLLRQLGVAIRRPARLFPCPPALLKWAGALTGRSAQVERLMDSLQVDSGKIRRELNWTPPYTLQQGLQATAEWYRNAHL
jgi:nucleoside-diphosphate-sugar epimerase